MADIVIACVDTQPVPEEVDDVLVRIFNEAGDALITSGTTGDLVPGSGEVELVVPPGTYRAKLSMSLQGYEVQGGSVQFIEVPDDNPYAFDFSIDLFQHPAATDSDLCRLSGYLLDAAKQPVPGAVIVFSPLGHPTAVGEAGILRSRIAVTTDDNGYAVVDLIREGRYEVLVRSMVDITAYVEIPDTSWANLADVLFPVPALVTFTPATLVLGIGDLAAVDVTVTMKSGLVLDLVDANSYVEFYCDPAGGVGIISCSDQLTLRGVSGGAFSIKARPTAGLIVRPEATVSGELPVNVS